MQDADPSSWMASCSLLFIEKTAPSPPGRLCTSVKTQLSLNVPVPLESLSRPSVRRCADLQARATRLGVALQPARFQSRVGILGHARLQNQLANSRTVPAGTVTSTTTEFRGRR